VTRVTTGQETVRNVPYAVRFDKTNIGGTVVSAQSAERLATRVMSTPHPARKYVPNAQGAGKMITDGKAARVLNAAESEVALAISGSAVDAQSVERFGMFLLLMAVFVFL